MKRRSFCGSVIGGILACIGLGRTPTGHVTLEYRSGNRAIRPKVRWVVWDECSIVQSPWWLA
jgi:hypothetical protein